MIKIFISFLMIFSILSAFSQTQPVYPDTRKSDQVDTYFGKDVADPYRWLEDDNSSETAEWVKQQNEVTFDYLSKIPFRDKINERLTKIWNYPKYGVPFKEGKYMFYYKNDGLQNQSVLYVLEEGIKEPRVLLDPNSMSEEGTTAIGSLSVSHDAKYLAYSVAKGGSDWNQVYVIEIASGKKLDDEINWVKFSGMSWKGNGFYYSAYDAPKEGDELQQKNEYHKVFYHTLGTLQSADKLVYENKEFPLRNYGASVTEDENFLLIYESESTSGVALYFNDLRKPGSPFIQIAKGFEYEYGVIDNIGEKLLVLTNYQAPKYKLVMIDPSNPDAANWTAVIPEKEEVLQSATLAGGLILAQYMKDVASKAYFYETDGKLVRELKLPTIGTLAGFNGKMKDKTAYYGFTSFTYPTTIMKYDMATDESTVFYQPSIDFKPDEYTVNQVFYKSKDGTKIPMFIVHKKNVVLDGNNPTLLYGYGGFNISLSPGFSLSRLIFLENGGVYAVANLRGGGEYGEEWHEAGTKMKKQNVFDDFIAAAEFLISEKYTSPAKLAINGGSNGGLLVGACMTQRPELFRVAMPDVGVMDMLRYHKFTIGWAWAGDYGTSEESKEMFEYLLGYSPVHNIKPGVEYPATMIRTADHDDRVVPAHSFKFAATLQENYKGKNPALIRIETNAGHGAGMPTSKLIQETADFWSFIFFNLGMDCK